MRYQRVIGSSRLVMQCFWYGVIDMNNPEKRRDYWYQLGQTQLNALAKSGERPKMLLHACCAPCNVSVIEQLYPAFQLTIYYNNDNIYPEAEYQRRLQELQRQIAIFNQVHASDVSLLVGVHDGPRFQKMLAPYHAEQEGGNRCDLCLEARLLDAFDYAQTHGYPWLSTVMTVSRCKNANTINQLAKKLAVDYQVQYLFADFKKRGGEDLSVRLCRQYDLYRQAYCGCAASLLAYRRKLMKKQENQ